jgi:hypothetical protein
MRWPWNAESVEVTGDVGTIASKVGLVMVNGNVAYGNVTTDSGDIEVKGHVAGNASSHSGKVSAALVEGDVKTCNGTATGTR